MKLSDGSWRNAAVLCVVLMGLTLAGCSQHESPPSAEETATADQHLPFEGTSDKDGIFPTGSLTPSAIPTGTPLTVHLRSPLSSATSRAGDSFEAVLDEPIIVRGQVVAPRGAGLTGKVLDAKASDQLHDPGYMRLALTAISLNGKSLPIQTSSIFVKRGSREKRNLTLIGGASTGGGSISGASMSGVSVSKASITNASITNASTGGLGSNRKGTLIEASTGTAAGLETGYAIEDKDIGVAPERRLTFRLAQPLPLGT